MGTQLQLSKVNVRVAFPDKKGHGPADIGTHVWMDVPGGAKPSEFKSQHFEVVKDSKDAAVRRLKPVSSNTRATATIDHSETYWCLWSAPGQALTVTDGFKKTQGFGWPLLAPHTSGGDLILPNTRSVIIREFNLSGGTTPDMASVRDLAKDFYTDLHIALQFDAQPTPTSDRRNKQIPSLFSDEGNPRGLRDVRALNTKPGSAFAPVVLALDEVPWVDRDKRKKTILLIWIKNFAEFDPKANKWVDADARGFAANTSHIGIGMQYEYAILGNLSPFPSVVFIATASRGDNYILAHELGHALLAEPGWGRELIATPTVENARKYTDRVTKVLTDLRLGMPTDEVIKLLPAKEHEKETRNLMFAKGIKDAKGVSPRDQLTFLQVALIRKAQELRWPEEVETEVGAISPGAEEEVVV